VARADYSQASGLQSLNDTRKIALTPRARGPPVTGTGQSPAPSVPSPQMNPTKTRTIWPYAIIAVFVLFAGYIGYMVQQAMRTTVDLVSPDYYQQELAYQQRMESVARTAALPAPVELRYEAAAQRLTLQLPPAIAGQLVQGEIHFFRPSNQQLDFRLPLQTGAQQLFSTAKMQPGYWRVRVDFTAGGQPYFVEKQLLLK
jgi:nitrogen fixation protein FixH